MNYYCGGCGSQLNSLSSEVINTRLSTIYQCPKCQYKTYLSEDYGQQDTLDTADVDAATLHRMVTDRLNRKGK